MNQWKSYTANEHNYILFELNNIHNERNYFDSMYDFWLKTFQMESDGGCDHKMGFIKMKKHIVLFLILLSVLIVILILYTVYKCYQKKNRYRTPNDLLQYPNFLTT
jgi:hypothetical protein